MKRAIIKRLILVAFLGIGTAQARIFTPVSDASGLAARTVNVVRMDSSGYLWIGSGEGLYRYDGYEAQVFFPDPQNPDAVSDIDIREVYEDSDGFIWIGTNSNGLDRYDPVSGTFENFRHVPANPASIADNRINSVSQGPDGAVWIATPAGLSRLDRASGSFETFRHQADRPGSLSADRVACLHLARSGRLWVGTVGGGVNLWDPESSTFSSYDLAKLTGGPAQRNDILALHEDEDQRLWAGTREGLVRLDTETGLAETADLGSDNEEPLIITTISADPAGLLWLSTMAHGLLVVDPDTGAWHPANPDPLGAPGNLTTDALMSLALASELVFVGTRGSGVFRAPTRANSFRLMNMQNTEGLGNNVISAVEATGEDGVPWVGTYGGGPRRVDVLQQAVFSMPLRRHGMRTSGVMSLAGPVDGRLYAATTHGLYEFSSDSAQVALFEYSPEFPDGIGNGDVISLLPDSQQGLWLGLGGSGLQYFETRRQRFTSFRHDAGRPDSLSGDFVTALLDEGDDHIWVGTRSAGLNLCRIEDWSCRRFTVSDGPESSLRHQHVTALYRDRRGRVWIGTDGGGLHRVQRNPGGEVTGFRHWDREDGLLSDRIMAIQEDLDESLWLSTRRGLSRFNPATGDSFNYVAASGLPASHFNKNASAADGKFIYFGSTDGLLSISKGTLLARRGPADVRIASVAYTAGGEPARVTNWTEEGLILPYQEEIAIELAVMDFTESEHEYAYRLQSSDPWISLGPNRQLLFRGLAPGRYDLQASGRNAYGVWGESEALELNIVPPFWMSAWFRALVFLLLLSLVWALHLARQAALKRRSDEMLRLGAAREKALEEQLGSEAELAVLTPRQKEILQLIAEGNATREIAELLGLSIKTVETHRANLMERLEIYDVPGLVRLAIRSRLVPLKN